jgi:hypothetical protein
MITYNGRHARVYRERGQASKQDCVWCEMPAAEWAQTHNTRGLSPDDYQAMCFSCHRFYDGSQRLLETCKWGHDLSKTRVRQGKQYVCITCKLARTRLYRANRLARGGTEDSSTKLAAILGSVGHMVS